MDNQHIRFHLAIEVNGKRHRLLTTGCNKRYDNHEIVLGPIQIKALGKQIAEILKSEGIDCCPIVILKSETKESNYE